MNYKWISVISAAVVALIYVVVPYILHRNKERKELNRQRSRERIEHLYIHLINRISIDISPRGVDPDEDLLYDLIRIINDKHMYATPELLELSNRIERVDTEYRHRRYLRNNSDKKYYKNSIFILINRIDKDYKKFWKRSGFGKPGWKLKIKQVMQNIPHCWNKIGEKVDDICDALNDRKRKK